MAGQQMLITRLVSLIIVEVAKPLRPHQRSVDVLERELNIFGNCEDVTCSVGKVFGEPKRRSEVLLRKVFLWSASTESDTKPISTSNREGKQCSMQVSCGQFSSDVLEQVVTCSAGKVFGVPKQLSRETRFAQSLSLAQPDETCSAELVSDHIPTADRGDVVICSSGTCFGAPCKRAIRRCANFGNGCPGRYPWQHQCLQAELSSSDDNKFSWVSLEQMGGLQSSKALLRLEVEEWSFYLQTAKHFDEIGQNVASYEALIPKWISTTKLSWRRTRQGGGVHAVLDWEVPGPMTSSGAVWITDHLDAHPAIGERTILCTR
eukprot:2955572-Amphidinium_carterae.1